MLIVDITAVRLEPHFENKWSPCEEVTDIPGLSIQPPPHMGDRYGPEHAWSAIMLLWNLERL